jgi:hypothetical protein
MLLVKSENLILAGIFLGDYDDEIIEYDDKSVKQICSFPAALKHMMNGGSCRRESLSGTFGFDGDGNLKYYKDGNTRSLKLFDYQANDWILIKTN